MGKEYEAKSYLEYIDIIHSNFDYGIFYRGLKDESYSLIPTVGRFLEVFEIRGFDKQYLLKREQDVLRIFRTEIRGHPDYEPENTCELMALAQHHGLPTRLMDWTLSPLVALYFAVVSPFDSNSIVYALKKDNKCFDAAQVKTIDPFKLNEPIVYLPPHISPRIRAQSGAFTIHADPTKTLKGNELTKIRIAKEARNDCKWALYKSGIHAKSLFPDLDGLAGWLKWGHFEGFQ